MYRLITLCCAMAAGCSLFLELEKGADLATGADGGLSLVADSGGDSPGFDGDAIDASVDAQATRDAGTAERCSELSGEFYCEDFDDGSLSLSSELYPIGEPKLTVLEGGVNESAAFGRLWLPKLGPTASSKRTARVILPVRGFSTGSGFELAFVMRHSFASTSSGYVMVLIDLDPDRVANDGGASPFVRLVATSASVQNATIEHGIPSYPMGLPTSLQLSATTWSKIGVKVNYVTRRASIGVNNTWQETAIPASVGISPAQKFAATIGFFNIPPTLLTSQETTLDLDNIVLRPL